MNLATKKELAKKALGVGKNRIMFNKEGLGDINEAITKNDIRDLVKEGLIVIKPIKGRRRKEKRKTKKGPGKMKMRIVPRKQTYVKITRKLRGIVRGLLEQGKISKDMYYELRKKIKTRAFKSKAQLKNYLVEEKITSDNIKEKKEEKSKTKQKIRRRNENR